MNELIFPPEMGLQIMQINQVGQQVEIYARSQGGQTPCPDCQTVSHKVQGRYWRHPQDLPCLGQRVRLHVQVRRFACGNQGCRRRTFGERFEGLLNPNARRTNRLREQHLEMAYALGGEAGSRLTHGLKMSISGDTLIRDIRQAPEAPVSSVRVVGIDDWALKKGQKYGTIVVDLEKQQPIALLDSREADQVSEWLKAHPEIEIVSRDRGKEYLKAVKEGAPQAEVVADRWHLLHNLKEAVTEVLQQKPAGLLAAGQLPEPALPPTEAGSDPPPSAIPPETAVSAPEPIKNPPPSYRQSRYEQVQQLHQAGYSDRAMARHLKMTARTVRKYREANTCPTYPPGRVRPSQLTPWRPYLEERWQAGCTNASQLWREICEQGFSGSLGLVIRWAVAHRPLLPTQARYRRQQPDTLKPALSYQVIPIPWSAQRAAWLVMLADDQLDETEQAARTRLLATDPALDTLDRLARQFIQMVKNRQPDELNPWLDEVAASGLQPLISFANGLRADLGAVRNGLTLNWSNGQTEGQINRLKFIKRQMYGRAKLDLLRKRVLYHPPDE